MGKVPNEPLKEKWRPKTFEQVVGIPDLPKIIETSKDLNTADNFLFLGPAGVGKTTIAKIIISTHQPVDVLKANGKQCGVEWVRDRLIPFSSSVSSIPGKKKIVFIDEFDGASLEAQKELRENMEKYTKNVLFLCTANYRHLILEPILSRFGYKYEFKKLKKADVMHRLREIVIAEQIEIENDDVLEGIYYKTSGDLRDAIGMLQQFGKKITVQDVRNITKMPVEIIKLIKEKKWDTIRREKVFEVDDFNQLLADMDELIYNSEALPTKTKIECNKIIAKGLYEISSIFRKDIMFCAICSELMGVLNVPSS